MDWGQFKAILWLRRRLSRNQFARSGVIGKIYAVIVPVLAVLVGAAAFAGGLLGGWFGLGDASATTVSLVWLGMTLAFLLFWTMGLLTEIQRSESIDLQRLVHLPVRLGQAFVINFIVSHAVLSVIAFVPAMIGVSLGLALARGPLLLLLVPLALAMVFMISSWTYCLRGWLGALMQNPRKRRAIIAGITITIILICQAPNLVSTFVRGRPHGAMGPGHVQTRSLLHTLNIAERYVPPLWVPLGADALASHRAWPAVLGTLGCLVIGALGLRRAYRITVTAYRCAARARTASRVQPAPAPANSAPPRKADRSGRLSLMERDIPGVPGEAAALAFGTLRSLMRAPEVKMGLATSLLVPLIVFGSALFRSPVSTPDWAKSLIATGAALFSVLMTMQFLANQFGYDRNGFRTLLLSPASRRNILLGKNLATMPICASMGLLLVAAVAITLRMPVLSVAAAVFQLAAAIGLAMIGGNLLSIYVPYKIQAGSLRPTKQPGKRILLMIGCQMLLPIVMAPLLIPPLTALLLGKMDIPGGQAVNLALSIAIAVGVISVYRALLDPFGRLLRRREITILHSVTSAVE